MFKHLPNTLTIIRFLLIPFIIFSAFQNNYVATIVILTISGITDVLDGFIARKFDLVTDIGKLLDPLADKATQVALLGALTILKFIPAWIIAIVLIKEFVMIAGASFLYGKDLVVSSKWYGKLSTVLFYMAIVCSLIIRYWNVSLIGKYGLNLIHLPQFDTILYYFAVLSTVFSLLMYIKAFYLQGYLKKNVETKIEK